MNNGQSYYGYGYGRHSGYRGDQYPRSGGYEGEEYYGGEEQHYDGEYGQDPQLFDEPYQDQNYHEESAAFERHTEHESSFFERSRDFNLDGGNFSSVAGSVYYTDDDSRSSPYEDPAPRPPNPRKTSYFKGASNFRITDGDFMSVGGDVYGLQRPSARQPGGPPRSRMQGQGRYGVPPPQGRPPPAGASQNPNGFGQGPETLQDAGTNKAEPKIKEGHMPHVACLDQLVVRLQAGEGQVEWTLEQTYSLPVRPPVSQAYRPWEDSNYYDDNQNEEYNPTIQVVRPAQSVPMHQVPTSTQQTYEDDQSGEHNPAIQVVRPAQSVPMHQVPTSTQQTSNAGITTSTTKLSSVEAQMGGLSIKASSERIHAHYIKHNEPAADHSRITMISPPTSSVIDPPPPANPYPSPRTSYYSSLDTIHNPNTLTATSQEQSYPPGPSMLSDQNPANSGVNEAEKRFKLSNILRRKDKKSHNK
ncbi:hypothetical protein GALMADRAFT_143126 [Galerina marginata CBS 339.88]|uniref:Uncharacterized protein n=1 Tax=Galerina marginata (strain CBS 339.88) TaxID=685588 RepID=A0A067SX37_GALM3|nr:hypothetical protein GALMADRAFT_143126 [Galerina marginata CBS 339.88]